MLPQRDEAGAGSCIRSLLYHSNRPTHDAEEFLRPSPDIRHELVALRRAARIEQLHGAGDHFERAAYLVA
jgi:hypothetical protein